MPFVRSDYPEGDVDGDDPPAVGDFEYYPAEEMAYERRPLDPDRLEPTAAAAYQMLRSAGLTRFRVRYDGGHDEGFAHAEAAWTADGVGWTLAHLLAELATPDRVAALREAGGYAGAGTGPAALVHAALDELADEMVGCLLGQGYGTGEYSMYGEVTADLTTGTLTDEPAAARPPDVTFD